MNANPKNKVIALAGNPNCGKTTLFNAFTGSKQYVGNWPGVTVEKKSGFMQLEDEQIEVIDLPGIYSITTYSTDETVARNFVIRDKPDLILNIIDATNLERNLYLTTQLLQLQQPTIVAVNMIDLAEKMNLKIDLQKLSIMLNCPVCPISASRKEGLEELKAIIQERLNQPEKIVKPVVIHYDEILAISLQKIKAKSSELAINNGFNPEWFGLKLLENDPECLNYISSELALEVESERKKIRKHVNMAPELLISDNIYGFINGICKEIIRKDKKFKANPSDKIDKIVLHPLLGMPIFGLVMYIVFNFSMSLSHPFISLIETFFGGLFVDAPSAILLNLGLPNWMVILLAEGIGGGIETVMTFIPPIFFIFFFLSVLEDSGYMARAAFVMDRVMHFLGLSGKSIIPMIVGFGCTVPAIMAARTLESKRDQVLTMLLVPFIQCGAKIPVYTMFAVLFFGAQAGMIIFGLYFLGIIFAVFSGMLFKYTLFKGKISEFVMELPSYHVPTWNGIFMHTWFKLKGFILRAGQTILFVIILLTMINSIKISYNPVLKKHDTILTISGRIITPIFSPMGIDKDNWGASVALFTGLFAKEAIVGTMQAVYLPEEVVNQHKFEFITLLKTSATTFIHETKVAAHKFLNPLSLDTEVDEQPNSPIRDAFKNIHQLIAYLLFIMIYSPCVAAIATVQKEAGTKVAVFQVIYLTLMAWITATLYYQIAVFTSISWFYILLCFLIFSAILLVMKKIELVEVK